MVGLQGGVATHQPVALRGALVILGTTSPAVIGGFVVVPDGDQRRCGAQGLEIGICVVLGIALAVVVKADDLAVRQESPIRGCVLRLPIAAGAVFVDVVAQMHHGVIGVDGMDGSGPAVGRELFGGGEVGAGEHRQAHRIAIHRQGFGLPHHRHHIASTEAVVIGGVGAEAIGLRLYRPVAGGAGGEYTAIDDRAGLETGAARHLPVDIQQPGEAGGWCETGPEDHRIGVGIAGGYAVDKTQSGGQGAAQFQIEQHWVVVGGAEGIGGEEVAHRRIAVAVRIAVVVAEGAFGRIDAPVEGCCGLGHERGRDQQVIQRSAHVHRGEEGVARGRLGGEAGQGIAITRRFKHLDRIFLGVGVDVTQHHPVGISAASGITLDPLQQPGGSCGAGGVEG